MFPPPALGAPVAEACSWLRFEAHGGTGAGGRLQAAAVRPGVTPAPASEAAVCLGVPSGSVFWKRHGLPVWEMLSRCVGKGFPGGSCPARSRERLRVPAHSRCPAVP